MAGNYDDEASASTPTLAYVSLNEGMSPGTFNQLSLFAPLLRPINGS